MTWIDIIFVIFVLIFGIIGIKRGFIKTILGMFTFLVTLFLVVWLAPKIVPVVDGWFHGDLSAFFARCMHDTVNGFGGAAGSVLTEPTNTIALIDGFTGINGVFKALLKVITGNKTLDAGTNVTDYFSGVLGSFILLLIGALVIFIIIRIIIALLGKLFEKVGDNRAFGGIDRLLGFILGIAKGFLYVAVALVLVRLLSFIPALNKFITDLLANSDWLGAFANWFYEILDKLIGKIDFNAIIGG